jgi:hypothetical protein
MKDANMDYSGITKQVLKNSGVIRVSSVAHKYLKSRSGPGAWGQTNSSSTAGREAYGKIGFDKFHIPKEKCIFKPIPRDTDIEISENDIHAKQEQAKSCRVSEDKLQSIRKCSKKRPLTGKIISSNTI